MGDSIKTGWHRTAFAYTPLPHHVSTVLALIAPEDVLTDNSAMVELESNNKDAERNLL